MKINWRNFKSWCSKTTMYSYHKIFLIKPIQRRNWNGGMTWLSNWTEMKRCEHEFRFGKRRTEWGGEILEKSEYLLAALRPQSHQDPYQSWSQWPGAGWLTHTRCAEKQWQAARVMGKGLCDFISHWALTCLLSKVEMAACTGTQFGTPWGA